MTGRQREGVLLAEILTNLSGVVYDWCIETFVSGSECILVVLSCLNAEECVAGAAIYCLYCLQIWSLYTCDTNRH